MKSNIFFAIIYVFFSLGSCSSDKYDETINVAPPIDIKYNYLASELETIRLINDYRIGIGLKALEKNDFISYKCEEHNNYMSTNNLVNHNGFTARLDEIVKVLGAARVGENVAYNYKTSRAALDGWLNSPEHKKNIEGDFNQIGISIRENSISGKKYYTNIFAKI